MNAKNTIMNKTTKTMIANSPVPTGPKWCLDLRYLRMNQIVTKAAMTPEIAAACQESKKFNTLSISEVL
jgi:hypothetical protein